MRADAYAVTVRGRGLEWRAEVRGATSLVYPDSAPVLQPGVAYKLIVTGAGRSSEEDQTPGQAFTILDSDTANAVRATQAQIEQLGLEDAPGRFLIAQLYLSNRLFADALDMLEGVSGLVREPAVLSAARRTSTPSQACSSWPSHTIWRPSSCRRLAAIAKVRRSPPVD